MARAEIDWWGIAAAVCQDPATSVAHLNLGKAEVTYARSIRGGESRRVISGPEEVVRAFLVHRLVHVLGYRPERIEIEREYTAGRGRRANKPRIDLILEDPDGGAFFFVEAKDPAKFEADKLLIKGQLFSLARLHEEDTGKKIAYLVYYTVEHRDGALIDKAIIIDHEKYPTYDEWVAAGEPSIGDTLASHYHKPQRTPLIKGGSRDLVHNFSLTDIEAIATNLHNVLWGGGATGDTEVFTSLVNLILAKIQDEYDAVEDAQYQFQVLSHGDEPEPPEVLFARVNELYRTALRQQLGKEGNLDDQWVVNKEKFALSKVLFTVGQIERYSFVDGKDSLTGRDILGEFFERIQRDGFKQTKGQFFTPPTVVRFMLYALRLDDMAISGLNDRQNLPYIIDPSCGSGTFLIEAMRMITNEMKRRRRHELLSNRTVKRRFEELFTPDNHEHRWARSHIYGVEHNFDLATASKVNMILHGDGASNIYHQDGLKPFRYFVGGNGDRLGNAVASANYGGRDVNERFDVVISNPPFSVELDGDTKKMLGASFAFGNKRNSENLFLERYFQLLAPGGRMAVVLPESVFDTTENKYIRLFLFWYFRVVAVVSLPQLAFAPYTQTKTSILFAQKKTLQEVEAWATAWQKAVSEYGKLRTRALNYIRVFVKGEAKSRFPSIATDDEVKVRQTIGAFLRLEPDPATPTETLPEFVARNQLLIEELAECDSEPNSMFGACNTAWVFATIVPQHDQEIFAAEVAHVGYKRTKRGVQVQPNELYSIEIAPPTLNLEALSALLSDQLERAQREVSALEARAAKPKGRRTKTKAEPEPPEGDPQDTNLHRRLGRARDALVEVETAERYIRETVGRFFDNEGRLLPEHVDRTAPDLLRLFDRSTMRPFRSNEVITQRATPITVLEKMRAATLWQPT